MRKILSVISIAIITFTAIYARKTVINPDYSYAPLTFSISKAELSDTATRIMADIYYKQGHWVKADTNIYLQGVQSNRKYPIRSVEGLKLGKEIHPSDSAYLNATFVFPPLEAQDSIVNFIEENGSWNVMNLNLGSQPTTGIATEISGTCYGHPEYSWLILMPRNASVRINKTILVPVRNGKFNYTLLTQDTLAYSVSPGYEAITRGTLYHHTFFTEGTPVHIDIPATYKLTGNLDVKGGELTNKINDFVVSSNRIIIDSGVNQLADSLEMTRTMYIPEVYAIKDSLDMGNLLPKEVRSSLNNRLNEYYKSGKAFSADGQGYNGLLNEVWQQVYDKEAKTIASDSTLFGLFQIYSAMKDKSDHFDDYLQAFKDIYYPKYPDHPYSVELQKFISDEAALPGYKVPDFTAPDLEGTPHTLSDLIKGKVALIDLWASWCGPCRAHSMDMIPVYERWKDKGFMVVGVAREKKDTRAMKKAIEHDGYPWVNLVELNDEGKIWDLFRAGDAGGKLILVGKDGKVIATDPSAKDVEGILKYLLTDN